MCIFLYIICSHGCVSLQLHIFGCIYVRGCVHSRVDAGHVYMWVGACARREMHMLPWGWSNNNRNIRASSKSDSREVGVVLSFVAMQAGEAEAADCCCCALPLEEAAAAAAGTAATASPHDPFTVDSSKESALVCSVCFASREGCLLVGLTDKSVTAWQLKVGSENLGVRTPERFYWGVRTLAYSSWGVRTPRSNHWGERIPEYHLLLSLTQLRRLTKPLPGRPPGSPG